MAGFIDNLQIYDQLVQNSYVETEAQFIPEFNGGTNGTILMGDAMIQGNYEARTFWKRQKNLVHFEDIKDNADVTDTQISQGERVCPKVKYRVGPVTWNPDSVRWEGQPEGAAFVALGEHLGTEVPLSKLNLCFKALITALGVGGTTKVDERGTTADATKRLTIPLLISAKRKLGDSRGGLVAFMRSETYYDMAVNNLSEYQEIFTYDEIFARRGPQNMTIIVLDNDELKYTHSSQTKYNVLLLQPGALRLLDIDQQRSVILPIMGKQNLGERYQAQGSVALDMMGWSFNKATTSPTLTEIGTPGNWSQAVADVRDGPGVLLQCQGTQP